MISSAPLEVVEAEGVPELVEHDLTPERLRALEAPVEVGAEPLVRVEDNRRLGALPDRATLAVARGVQLDRATEAERRLGDEVGHLGLVGERDQQVLVAGQPGVFGLERDLVGRADVLDGDSGGHRGLGHGHLREQDAERPHVVTVHGVADRLARVEGVADAVVVQEDVVGRVAARCVGVEHVGGGAAVEAVPARRGDAHLVAAVPVEGAGDGELALLGALVAGEGVPAAGQLDLQLDLRLPSGHPPVGGHGAGGGVVGGRVPDNLALVAVAVTVTATGHGG
jgi:hypothetical protein